MSHTPGPWHWKSNYFGEISSLEPDVIILDSHGTCLEVDPEDADLIAAAPDLLASLEAIMEWIDNWDPNFIHDAEWPADRDAANAAIALAKRGPA